jgi:hypothetical protein
MGDTCAGKKPFFSRLVGESANDHYVPYDGRLDEKIDASNLLSGVKLQRRTEIIVTGDPERVQELGGAVVEVQKGLMTNPDHSVDMRVTAFLDGCIHSTGWSTKPVDVRAESDQWHCSESETLFAQAFRATADEYSRRGRIDSVFIIGHKFDEDVEDVQKAAQKLADLKTPVHALVVSKLAENVAEILKKFKAVADITKGHAVAVENMNAVREAMPFLIVTMFPFAKMAALPAPKDAGVKGLVKLLAAPKS